MINIEHDFGYLEAFFQQVSHLFQRTVLCLVSALVGSDSHHDSPLKTKSCLTNDVQHNDNHATT